VEPGKAFSVGSAQVIVDSAGEETWTVADDATKQWLLWLGSLNIGGFREKTPVSAGHHSIVRTLGPRLSESLPTEPVAWRRACELVRVLAKGLAACVERKVRAGPIEPETLAWSGPSEHASLVIADSGAVLRLVNAQHRWPTTPGLWRPFDSPPSKPSITADCYALGRLLYRLLTAEEPFAKPMARRKEDEPSPMAPATAEALPPGLQTFVLAMISNRPRERPQSLGEIIDKLESFSSLPEVSRTVFSTGEEEEEYTESVLRRDQVARMMPHVQPAAPQVAPAPPRPTHEPEAPRKRKRGAWLGSALMVAVLAPAAWFGSGMLEQSATAGGTLRPTRALVADRTRPSDCGSCHARQTLEWRRSIMGQSARSPLFQSLEMLIEEQVGRSDQCPQGAGALRFADVDTACRVGGNGRSITGAGGEGWCINCHSPLTNLGDQVPAWDATTKDSKRRRPLASMLSDSQLEGIDCAFCHQVQRGATGEDLKAGNYVGNDGWRSFLADRTFSMRPEAPDHGIANSGYVLDADVFLGQTGDHGMPHAETPDDVREYRKSSEFCGSCHDVRLFGTDSIGVERGEHFKRLRNAYSEWKVWADARREAKEPVHSCQDCHMSLFPGVCEPGAGNGDAKDGDAALLRACPDDMHFSARAPGTFPQGPVANRSGSSEIVSHYFSSVDVPLTPAFPDDFLEEKAVDISGTPLGLEARRDLLLGTAFRFELEPAKRRAKELEIPLVLENVGAGHRIPAGFSQEREIWVHLRVTDAKGKLVYEVGKVERGDEDLHDKVFDEVTTSDDNTDDAGQPLGLFGANVSDGPDVPKWDPDPALGGTEFRGLGLINLQNGFLRCVSCRGRIDSDGHCKPGLFQNGHRADRYEDGDYDIDTGECRSNLEGHHKFLEIFFPVGALDADRGVVRGPDAIIDTRSIAPDVPVRYTFVLPVDGGFEGPFEVEARLLFRGFPPFLLKAFAEYEAHMDAQGERPDGPLLTKDVLERLEVVELNRASRTIE